METRDFEIPLQNGSVAVLPVPMTQADHAFLLKTLEAINPMHVREIPIPIVRDGIEILDPVPDQSEDKK